MRADVGFKNSGKDDAVDDHCGGQAGHWVAPRLGVSGSRKSLSASRVSRVGAGAEIRCEVPGARGTRRGTRLDGDVTPDLHPYGDALRTANS
jgi:hypothetical protein